MNQKKIKLFLLFTPGDEKSVFAQQMENLMERLKNHPRVQFMKYPNFVVDDPDPDSEKSLSTRIFEVIEKNILEADLLVAVATYGSSGLGMEIGIGNSCNRKTLVCFDAQKTDRSHMIMGSVIRNPNLQIIEYSPENSLFDQIIKQVESML